MNSMEKVYILLFGEYETSIVGVYDTYEKAKKVYSEYKEEGKYVDIETYKLNETI